MSRPKITPDNDPELRAQKDRLILGLSPGTCGRCGQVRGVRLVTWADKFGTLLACRPCFKAMRGDPCWGKVETVKRRDRPIPRA